MSRDRFSPFEFALVVGIAFGWPILGSLQGLLTGRTMEGAAAGHYFSDAHLYQVIYAELICAPILVALLYYRGWRLQDFPMGISRSATALGVLAFAVVWMSNYAITAALAALFDTLAPALEQLDAYKPHHAPNLVAIYLLSVINPVFEEVIVCGYVMVAVASRFGVTAAINTSVLIRVSYHLYQGVAALPFHAIYGLLQAYLYARFGKLWPLIVSHALLDFVALLYLL